VHNGSFWSAQNGITFLCRVLYQHWPAPRAGLKRSRLVELAAGGDPGGEPAERMQ
jgi:hypothetical protein